VQQEWKLASAGHRCWLDGAALQGISANLGEALIPIAASPSIQVRKTIAAEYPAYRALPTRLTSVAESLLGERPKQHRVDSGKNCRVRAYAQRKRHYHHDAEARIF